MNNNFEPTGVLDIGSHQLKFIIFKVEHYKLEILSKSISYTKGIKKGSISDLNKLSESIKNLIGKAEENTKIKIKKIYISPSPTNISFVNFCQSKNIGGYEVDHEKDMQFLINSGVTLFKEQNKNCSILHLFNLNSKIDKDIVCENPTGMIADTLENEMNILYSKTNTVKNFEKVISKSYLKSEKIIYSPYVLALLSYADSPLADMSMTIDVGHEKTSVSIFRNDGFVYASSIPIGSWHITNDISKALNLSFEISENLKKDHSSCSVVNNDKMQEFVETEESGFRSYKKISNNILNTVVNARVEEIIDLINQDLIFLKTKNLNFNKILVTGEGSKLDGFLATLKERLDYKSLSIERFNPKIKKDIPDNFDVCISVINLIINPYIKEIPLFSKKKKGFFEKIYSFLN
jgi:cell division protein FtsA